MSALSLNQSSSPEALGSLLNSKPEPFGISLQVSLMHRLYETLKTADQILTFGAIPKKWLHEELLRQGSACYNLCLFFILFVLFLSGLKNNVASVSVLLNCEWKHALDYCECSWSLHNLLPMAVNCRMPLPPGTAETLDFKPPHDPNYKNDSGFCYQMLMDLMILNAMARVNCSKEDIAFTVHCKMLVGNGSRMSTRLRMTVNSSSELRHPADCLFQRCSLTLQNCFSTLPETLIGSSCNK